MGWLLKSSALEACSIFSFAEKDLAAVKDESNRSQQGALAAKGVDHILACINKAVASRNTEKILCLWHSWGCVWSTVFSFGQERVGQLELIQPKASKPVWELESMIHEERLRELGLFSLEKKRIGRASNCCLHLSRGMILGCPIYSTLDIRAVYICRSCTPVFNHTVVTCTNWLVGHMIVTL